MDILIGAVMIAAAGVLILIGLPSRTGDQPKFLRFEAALVLYPPVILSFQGLRRGGADFRPAHRVVCFRDGRGGPSESVPETQSVSGLGWKPVVQEADA